MSNYLPTEQRRLAADHVPNQLVVAIPDKSLVLDRLKALRLDARVSKVSWGLGLALVEIENLDGRDFRDDIEATCRSPQLWWLPVPDPDPERTSQLDAVLFLIRWYFATRYGGWTPTLAKNYEMETVTGLPHIDGIAPHAAYYPEPADAALLRWAPQYLGRGVKVGIVDTPLYECRLLREHYVAPDRLPMRGYQTDGGLSQWAGHNDMCTGLIVQQAGGVEIFAEPVLRPETATTTSWHLAESMVALRDAGVSIINVSAGCSTRDGRAPLVLERAIDNLWPDVLIVASVGNHGNQPVPPFDPREPLGPTSPMWPAANPRVLSVGSYGVIDKRLCLAEFNPPVPWQTLVAKGVDVVSTYLESEVTIVHSAERVANGVRSTVSATTETFTGVARWSGSSFATATVTGAIAARMTGGASAQEALARLMVDAATGVDGIWTYDEATKWGCGPVSTE
jgi:subtilisin family serine protease